MFDRADAFVALPGGIGTLEELVEQLTWSQLGRHRSRSSLPISKASDPFLKLLDHMTNETSSARVLPVHVTVVDIFEEILPAIFANAEHQATAKEDAVFGKILEA